MKSRMRCGIPLLFLILCCFTLSPSQAQLVLGDLNVDGEVNYLDALILIQTWGHRGAVERLFSVREDWGAAVAYPPALSSVVHEFERRGKEPVVHVNSHGVARIFWIGRDLNSVFQIQTAAIQPWGQITRIENQLTDREAISVIPGLPPGSPKLNGLRTAARRLGTGDFYLVFPGYQGQVHMIRFHSLGYATSSEIRLGATIQNLDSVDAAVDEDGNLHVAAMARVDFASSTRQITYQKFSHSGAQLINRIPLGIRLETGGGSSELPHPEVCIIDDRNVLVLWDQGEGTGTGPGTPETSPTQGVLVDGMNGQILSHLPFEEAWVEPECHWIPGVGVAIVYMQFVVGDGREIYYTVLDENDFTPKFPPVRISPPASTQFDGAQLFPVGSQLYLAFNREGNDPLHKPLLARVATNGAVTGPFPVDGPEGGGLFEGPVRIGVDPEGNAHLVYGRENLDVPGDDFINYVRTRIE